MFLWFIVMKTYHISVLCFRMHVTLCAAHFAAADVSRAGSARARQAPAQADAARTQGMRIVLHSREAIDGLRLVAINSNDLIFIDFRSNTIDTFHIV